MALVIQVSLARVGVFDTRSAADAQAVNLLHCCQTCDRKILDMKQKLGWLLPIWTIIWKCVLFFSLWGILSALFIIPFTDQLEQFEKVYPLQAQLYFDVAGALAMLIAAWIMVRFIDRRPFITLGFAPGDIVRDFLLGVCIGTVWLGLSVLVLWTMNWVSLRPSVTISWSILAWIAVALVFNTLTQEVLVRSYIYQTIQSQTNFIWAIVLSSVLFMALHAGAFEGAWLPAVNVFLAGILFGVAYHLTGNLWLPTAIHFTWNFLLGPALGLTVSGQNQLNGGWQVFTVHGPALWTGGSFGVEGGLIVTLTTVIGTVAMFLLLRRRITSQNIKQKAAG